MRTKAYAAVVLRGGREVTPRVPCEVEIERNLYDELVVRVPGGLTTPPVSKGGVGTLRFFAAEEGSEWLVEMVTAPKNIGRGDSVFVS
jgi:hypothetical protein